MTTTTSRSFVKTAAAVAFLAVRLLSLLCCEQPPWLHNSAHLATAEAAAAAASAFCPSAAAVSQRRRRRQGRQQQQRDGAKFRGQQQRQRLVLVELQASPLRSNLLDPFLPWYYELEKYVAGRSIPNVSTFPAERIRLKDHLTTTTTAAATPTSTFDHSSWDKVLKRYVVPGCAFGACRDVNGVDYDGIGGDEDFASYLEQLEKAAPPNADLAPGSEQLAFWINAYNALCINKIVQYEKRTGKRVGSINELSNSGGGGEDGSEYAGPVWDQVAGKVAGRDVTLNEIEHDELRRVWAEPAVHACIVCASASCPNLRREAFVSSRLQEQMNDQMKEWMANDSKGLKLTKNSEESLLFGSLIPSSPDKLELSRIFLWFRDDFEVDSEGGMRTWLARYVDDDATAAALKSGSYRLRYFEYDWQITRASSSS